MYIFEIVAVTYGTIFDSCLSVFFACGSPLLAVGKSRPYPLLLLSEKNQTV